MKTFGLRFQPLPTPVVQHKNWSALTNVKNRRKYDFQNKLK